MIAALLLLATVADASRDALDLLGHLDHLQLASEAS